MRRVVDASVVLAVCHQEPGATEARSKMRGGLISTVNLSEVYQKSLELGKLPLAQAIVSTAGLQIIPFLEPHALRAAEIHIHTKKKGISFADRACLALGIAEGLTVLTADQQWLTLGLELPIEVFR